MPVIHLETFIKASVQTVFDLSRSVDLHKSSMIHHKEEIIDGITQGFIKDGDTVTWRATHLFKSRRLKVIITEMDIPHFFCDEMLKGDFAMMRHKHAFKTFDNGTLMVDDFCFETPFGIVGEIVNILFLTQYMKSLLLEHNKKLKHIAEANLYKEFLT